MKKTILHILVGLVAPFSSLQAGDAADPLVKEGLAKNPELTFYTAEIAAARGASSRHQLFLSRRPCTRRA